MTMPTRDGWGVSATTSSTFRGAQLNVYKFFERPGRRALMRKGDADGKMFATSEAAHAYAEERGYAEPHITRQWCPRCRVLHTTLGSAGPRGSGWCPVAGTFLSHLEAEIPTRLP